MDVMSAQAEGEGIISVHSPELVLNGTEDWPSARLVPFINTL